VEEPSLSLEINADEKCNALNSREKKDDQKYF
jgi:hypothetical protein